jgi:hypothetical protein
MILGYCKKIDLILPGLILVKVTVVATGVV